MLFDPHWSKKESICWNSTVYSNVLVNAVFHQYKRDIAGLEKQAMEEKQPGRRDRSWPEQSKGCKLNRQALLAGTLGGTWTQGVSVTAWHEALRSLSLCSA